MVRSSHFVARLSVRATAAVHTSKQTLRTRYSSYDVQRNWRTSCSSRAFSSSSARPRVRDWPQDRAGVTFQFKCTQCGKCCTGKGGRVRVNEREIEEIAAALGVASVADVKRTYLRQVPVVPSPSEAHDATETPTQQWVLRQTPDDTQCIFLDGAKCRIYQARPTQCRTFPWWPQHLVSDYDWQLAAQDCEGIILSPADAPNQAVSDPTVFPFDTVLPHAIVHEIHRSGENFTHDELQALLTDVLAADPDVARDYKRELVHSVARRVVHCDADVTVLDTITQNEAPTRCFVFNDRLHLVQSEVTLLQSATTAASDGAVDGDGDNDVTIDRRALALDVHRAMCIAFALAPPASATSSGTDTSTATAIGADSIVPPSHTLRVAVLGSGAATLPLFLLAHVDAIAQLDAIEPSAAVNRVARQYFGLAAAERGDARLRVHECTGEAFVAAQLCGVDSSSDAAATRYDVLLLDVEAGDSTPSDADATDELRGVRAPPAAMLTRAFLADVRALLAPTGVLVVNVIAADDAALARAEAALVRGFAAADSAVGSAGLVVQLEKNAVAFLVGDSHPLTAAVRRANSHESVRDDSAADAVSEDDVALQSHVAALLSCDAFQSQRVRSLELLEQRVLRVRRIRTGESSPPTAAAAAASVDV